MVNQFRYKTMVKRVFLLLTAVLYFQFSFASTNDSNYIRDPFYQKLLKTNSKVPIFFNEQVKKQIGVYIKNLNNSTAILIGKTQYYNQNYGAIFDSAKVPRQLFLVASAFSNCDPLYLDDDGGSGMWALTYAIAKKYLLTTNSYIDERRNPKAGTIAASKYFNDLNEIYQDWLKSLVAFRTGPINMNMAIHRANNSLDYDNIHPFLSADYQNAAVNYMAFWFIWNYYHEYKIVPVKYKLPETDTVQVQREIGFNAISYNLNISEDILRLCNTDLRLDIVPTSYNEKGLRIPKDKKAEYIEKSKLLFPEQYSGIDSSVRDSLILDNNPLQPRNLTKVDSLNNQNDEEEDEPKKPKTTDNSIVTIYYTVKYGDNLLLLADVFDCKLSDLKKWNGIKKDAIFKGQKLKVRVPKKKMAYYKKINTMTMSQKRKLAQRG